MIFGDTETNLKCDACLDDYGVRIPGASAIAADKIRSIAACSGWVMRIEGDEIRDYCGECFVEQEGGRSA
jgi:hypothetical protein